MTGGGARAHSVRMKASRHLVLAIAVTAPADARSVRKVLEHKRTQEAVRARIEAAIVQLGLSDLLAKPLTDPDASPDLGR